MILVLKIVFFLITGYYIFCSLYVFIYAVAGLFYISPHYPKAKKYRKIAILVPTYKADNVIKELVDNVLSQDYPGFELIIIADSLKKETMEYLNAMPVKTVEFFDENRTKALAINTTIRQLSDDYDVVLILDADNLIKDTDYLLRLNDIFDSGVKAIQTHRTAKNTNTYLAILDAMSEEINNHIFRRGHAALGLTSTLIGSAMAFDYSMYKEQMQGISSTGEDKELDIKLAQNGIYVVYSEDLVVFDEKTQKINSFVTQRSRWMANQIVQARNNMNEWLKEIFHNNFGFIDKVLQYILLPRILLLSTGFVFTIISIIFLPFSHYIIWVVIIFLTCMGLLLSIPLRMYNRLFIRALLYLPVGAALMFFSIFKTKGKNERGGATEHDIITDKFSK